MALPKQSSPALTKVGHGLAKVFGIKLRYRNPTNEDPLTRGESAYSSTIVDTYIDQEPTTAEWINSVTPSPRTIGRWAYSLFPFVHWIDRYNLQWLTGDLVAGKSEIHRVGGPATDTRPQVSPSVPLSSLSRWLTQLSLN